ncbi:MAG: ACT domain-containing protein [Anaerolineae bacterium]|jgi:hypothetical protein
MPTEFTVTLRNTPGALAELGAALGKKGVNIAALQAMSFKDQSVLHLVVNDPDVAVREFEDYGLPFRTRQVLSVSVADEPGTLGKLAERLSDSGVNIDAVYLAMDQNVILGVSDLPAAARVIKQMGLRHKA